MKMFSTDSTTAEALAAIQAVLFRKERNYQHIIFEENVMQIVQAINDPSPRQSSYGHIVEGIQAEFSSSVIFC
jgi:predicted sugar kinase